MKNYTLHVSGTHCASCKILIEDILGDQDIVKNVHVNLKKEIVHIDTDSDNSGEELANMLTEKIKSHGYTLSVEKITKEKQSDDIIWKAIPIGLAFLTLFFVLQKSGILDLGIGGKLTPQAGFIIGLIASVSSCLK
jgi:cation transport ATPase